MERRQSWGHKVAVMVFRALPRPVSGAIVRLLKPTYPVGVVAVVFNAAGEVLVLHHTYGKPAWRLPGGLLERGEEPFQTAQRETLEEVNCVVEPVMVVSAAPVRYSFDVAVLARLKQELEFIPNAEISARRWQSVEDLEGLTETQRGFVEAAYRANKRMFFGL